MPSVAVSNTQTGKEHIMKENLAKLLKVKTIVTLAVTAVFAALSIAGKISPDNVMVIVSMVVSFYFGTQHERN